MITFAEFLKKYSTIPNQFIDDFFKILKLNSLLSKYLKVLFDPIRKTSITELFQSCYFKQTFLLYELWNL